MITTFYPEPAGRRRAATTDSSTARDISRGAYETVVGPHQQTHRRDS